MPAEQFANLQQTTLANNYTSGSGQLQLTSSAGFPSSGNYTVAVLNSSGQTALLFRVTSVSGNNLNGSAEGLDTNQLAGATVVGTELSAAACNNMLTAPFTTINLGTSAGPYNNINISSSFGTGGQPAFIQLSGPTTNYSITGFTPPPATVNSPSGYGQVINVSFNSNFTCTIVSQSASSSVGNRIITSSGPLGGNTSNITLYPGAMASFVYVNDLISLSGAAWQLLSTSTNPFLGVIAPEVTLLGLSSVSVNENVDISGALLGGYATSINPIIANITSNSISPSNPFSIGGYKNANGISGGQQLIVINNSGQPMTTVNNDGGSSPNILTSTGSNITTANNKAIIFMNNGFNWFDIFHN